jgi:hypothetical protein
MPDHERDTLQKPKRISWWRLGLGAFLLLGQIKSLLFPGSIPAGLEASNLTQQQAMDAGSIVIGLVALWLLYSGFMSAWPRPSE